MNKKWVSRSLAMLLSLTTAGSVVPVLTAVHAEADTTGKTYYVDSEKGSDKNDGLSERKAFKTLDKINELVLGPGDEVLLKAGSTFEDQALHLQGSGSAEAPIKVSSYGKGDRPAIHTNGHGQWELNYGKRLDNQNHKWHGTVSSSILLKDVEYIEISGLELTNDRKAASDPEKGKEYNDPLVMDRTGVAGFTQNIGTADHIVLDDLYIHDVTGNVYNKHMTNGGIYFVVGKPENEQETGIARYNDVEIRNCHLDTVNRWGIAVGYTYQWDKFNGAVLNDETMKKYASSNVVIENNYLNNTGGDAITTMYVDRPMIQYNVSDHAAAQINTTDYSKKQPYLDAAGNPTGNGAIQGRVAAGIWPWKCKNAIFQYNECYNTLGAGRGNGDGQPWDSDYGDGTNYQYNYSHGNTAAAIMFCGGESINNTFRYNISYREDMGPLDPAGNVGNTQVYNNTFVMKEGIRSIYYRNSGPINAENNIFYFEGSKPAEVADWNPGGNKKFSNNLYYNVKNIPEDAQAVKVDAGKQIFEDLSTAPVGPSEDHRARKHEDPNSSTVFDGFKLAEGSPAIDRGKYVVDKNGYANDKDFFGHAITAIPEIGAAESDHITALALRSDVYTVDGKNITGLAKNTTVEQFKNNCVVDNGVAVTVKNGNEVLKDSDIVKGGMQVELSLDGYETVVYTIVANHDNALKETVYEVKDHTLNIPSTANNPTKVSSVKSNIVVHPTAEVSVWNGDQAVKDTDVVSEGMIVRITAEDGTKNEFTIHVKNAYNWTADYAGPQAGKQPVQGNVWFGQNRPDGGNWTNLSSADAGGWPNWTNGIWPIGIDNGGAPNNPITNEMHGLIGSPVGNDSAMMYRAPKDGFVSFAVRDGENDAVKEPYFRQDNNANGPRQVVLSVTLNDKVLDSITLTADKRNVSAGEWDNHKQNFDRIEVKKEDCIRVAVTSTKNTARNTIHVTPTITYLDEAVPDTEAPAAPTDVRVTNVTVDSAHAAWEPSYDNTETVGYNVYVGDTKWNTDLITGTEVDLTGLAGNTEYVIRVEAVDAAGNVSEKSAELHFTTKTPLVLDGLESLINKAEEELQQSDRYEAESVKELQKTYEAAKELLQDPALDQERIDAMVKRLENAIGALQEKKPEQSGTPLIPLEPSQPVEPENKPNQPTPSAPAEKPADKPATADERQPLLWTSLFAAAGAAVILVMKKK